MRPLTRASIATAACFLLAFGAAAPALAQALAPSGPAAAQRPTGLKDPAELEAFLDGVMATQKDLNHIVGATVAVVANGELFFAKGYGFANKATGKPVDPARTLFRIGSVSKLFTWTAVMQLVEQGRLDLNADVNRYLAGSPIHVPDTYPQPVTMVNLLTHTPGFEDEVLGLFAKTPDSMRPLGDVLAARFPARVRPPGVLPSYSNHGVALAGYIVERIAKMPYEEYVEKNILAPLEMSHTAVRQPVPAALKADMSAGYKFTAGEQQVKGFEYVPVSPAGAMSSSAVDMAHFMLAHLQQGRYGQARILEEATARRMHTRLFGGAPELNAMLYGFYEMNRNGHRVYGHGGDTFWFHTELALLPDDEVGFFVSYNSDSGAAPRTAIVKVFLDRYFPAATAPAAAASAPAKLREPTGTFAGTYRSIRMSYTTFAKAAGLLSSVSVSELPDGRLLVDGLDENPTRWVEVAPLLFKNVDSEDKIAFRRDSSGAVSTLLVSFPAIAFERLPLLERPTTHVVAGGVSLVFFVMAVVAWPVVAWRRRRLPRGGLPPRAPRLLAWLMSLALLVFAAGTAVILSDVEEVVYGVPISLKALLALPLVAVALVVVGVFDVFRAWGRRWWTVGARVFFTLVVAAAVVFLAILDYWNLLGYHY